MKREIIDYYDRLAPDYDIIRFGTGYGRFIDARERQLLAAWLPADKKDVLELGCGTGRLSSFAQVASDASKPSLGIARARCPATRFVAADAARLPFAAKAFDAVFAFHLLMHLENDAVRSILAETARVLRPGGTLIADVVSATRRRLTGERKVKEHHWHAATAFSAGGFKALCREAGLRPVRMTGLMFLPIHRLPDRAKPLFSGLDDRLAQRMPSLSSYLVGCFAKA